MDNSYFVFTDSPEKITIERFHICTWEFKNNTALVELGCEINAAALASKDSLDVNFFIPWLEKKNKTEDYYLKLKEPSNSRFVFNDSIINTYSLDGGQNSHGVVHEFTGRNKLCFLPVKFQIREMDCKLVVKIDLTRYNRSPQSHGENKPNIYIRFSLNPHPSQVSTRKKGINKSTILYDIKINERRNIPQKYFDSISNGKLCAINSCFCLNIIPNSYNISFFEADHLRKIRGLEYEPFKDYLKDNRLKKDDLMAVVHKKDNTISYSFFSIYTKERIGTGQFSLAFLINFLCGILLFIPAYRKSVNPELSLKNVWFNFPIEIYLAFGIGLSTIIYFILPTISNSWMWLLNKLSKTK
jgi:hypothetical protein